MTQELIDMHGEKLTEERRTKLNNTIDQRTRFFTMVLEDLKDPHNISAVIRTSEVFGLQDVHIIEEINSYNISKAILKGSFKWLSLYRYKKRATCMDYLRKKGYQIAVASTNTEQTIYDLDYSKPTAFYMGSESLGNHPDTLKQADVHFKIPQYGLTESMNVSVCAGVLMSTLNQWMLRKGREHYSLSEKEKQDLRGAFYERSARGVEWNSPVTFME
jgi:tRNA (guanosine-2'-O-)-methyltransferase